MKALKTLGYLLVTLAVMAIAGCTSSKPLTEADIANHNAAAQMLTDKQFLIKSDRIVVDKHSFSGVSPTTNFILVDGDDATVQVSPGVAGGPNGIGGFTVKGKISNYELTTKSNGEVNVKFNVMATVGSCSVFVTLTKYGNNANVNINNTFRGKNATLFGKVTDIDDTFFTGRTRF